MIRLIWFFKLDSVVSYDLLFFSWFLLLYSVNDRNSVTKWWGLRYDSGYSEARIMTASDQTQLLHIVNRLAERLLVRKQSLAVAESCTGGWLAKSCTDLAGSSQWFERGLVTYSNAAKVDLLAVPNDIIEQHGAVS